MNRVGLMGLLQIDLPGETIRLCDGGFLVWGANTFRSKHPVFGSIASLEGMSEGAGEEVPSLEMTLLPGPDATPGELSQPGFQKALVSIWLAEYIPETGLISGTPDLLFYGQIDQTFINRGRDKFELAMTIVSTAERLFERNAGNSLSPMFHRSIWPGETGHDNASGLTKPVAWGVEAPPATGSGSGGSSGAGGFRGVYWQPG